MAPEGSAFGAENRAALTKLANARMPFGKYAGRYLTELPDAYLVWFAQKGFPKGELGRMLRSAYEIRLNGLEHLLRPLRDDVNGFAGEGARG